MRFLRQLGVICARDYSYSKFFRGEYSLSRSFWLFALFGVFLVALLISCIHAQFGNRILCHFGCRAMKNFYIGMHVTLGIYLVFALIGVWRSVLRHKCSRIWSLLALCVLVYIFIGQPVSIFRLVTHKYDPSVNLDLEKNSDNIEEYAQATEKHPYAGFWKEYCDDGWGFALAPAENQMYSVSHCGPGACDKPGKAYPNTSLVADNDYRIIEQNIIEISRGRDFLFRKIWKRLYRCSALAEKAKPLRWFEHKTTSIKHPSEVKTTKPRLSGSTSENITILTEMVSG